MKEARIFYLINEAIRRNAINYLMDEPVDGTRKITFQGAGTKSARQRGLQWLWIGDVVKAGIGGKHETDKTRLHRACKFRWCLPIQVRDDDAFAELWLDFNKRHENNPDEIEWFVDKIVSTEALDQSQMAEYLTEFKNYYGYELEVNLTDPEELGWNNLLDHRGTK